MKLALIFSLMSLTTFTWAANDWKVVAETTKCSDKLQVLAKEGEKHVFVVQGEKKTQLMSEDGAAFSTTSGDELTFTNANDKNTSDKYTFVQPSMVNGNPAKLAIAANGVKDNCKMNLK